MPAPTTDTWRARWVSVLTSPQASTNEDSRIAYSACPSVEKLNDSLPSPPGAHCPRELQYCPMAAAKPHVPISAVGTAVAGGVVTGAPELAAELPASCVAVPASPPPPHALSA